MESLANAKAGDVCTIKWMLGNLQALELIRGYDIREGSQIRVIQKTLHDVIIGTDRVRLAIGSDVAERIKIRQHLPEQIGFLKKLPEIS